MDPKNLPTTLDPKLKEAYERVMGVQPSAPPPPTPPPLQPAPPAPLPVQPAAPLHTEKVTISQPPTPPATPSHHATTTFVAAAGEVSKSKPKISPTIFIFVGVIFFVVYAIFWMRFFNLSLPFLP